MNRLLILASEAAEGAEHAADSTRLIIPEKAELIFGIIAFIAFFIFVAWKVVPQFKAAMKSREDAIRGDLERAEQARLEAEQLKEQYQQQLAEARSQADSVVREAQAAGEQARRDIVARAEEEARQIRERAQADLGQERERVLSSLRREVADISIAAAQRVVEKELSDPAAQRQLVEQFISRLGS